MSAPVISFLTTTPAVTPAGSVAVPVGPANPFPVTVIGGVGTSTLQVESGAGADNQSNNLAFLKNDPADPDLALASAPFLYDPVTGLWERNRGQTAIYDSIAQVWVRNEGYAWGHAGNLINSFNAGLAGGSTTVIFAATAGIQYMITGVNYASTLASSGAIQSTAGTNFFTWSSVAGVNDNEQFSTPILFPVGLGVQIVIGANAMNVGLNGLRRRP